VSLHAGSIARGKTHLALKENSPDAVEELEGRDDVALDQHARAQRRRHPPPCAHGHLVEPLLEREPAHHSVPAAQNVCHGGPAGGRGARRRVAIASVGGCREVRRGTEGGVRGVRSRERESQDRWTLGYEAKLLHVAT
jgi:hypothetical protein